MYKKIIAHWKAIKTTVVVISLIVFGFSVLPGVLGEDRVLVLVMILGLSAVTVLMYGAPYFFRAVAQLNSTLLGTMNPSSIGIQLAMLWFSLVLYSIITIVWMVFRDLETAMSQVFIAGLLLGSGNFLSDHVKAKNEQGVASNPETLTRSES